MTVPTSRLLATGQLGTRRQRQIDTTTGTVKLRAMFANPDEMLLPEPVRQCAIAGATRCSDTVRVPVPAVQRGEPERSCT